MELNELKTKFRKHLKKMDAYSHAMGVMSYDSETAMPKNGAEDYAGAIGVMSEESYNLLVNDELRDMLKELSEHKGELDKITAKEVEKLTENLDKMGRVPVEEYAQYSELTSKAASVWREAKNKDDYAMFEPYLSKIVEFQQRFAGYFDPKKSVYDTWLNEFEKGLTQEVCDKYFAAVRAELVPLIKEIAERGRPIDDAFAGLNYPVKGQRELSEYIMKAMTINPDDCTLGEVEHPFTTNFSKHDVRITTHYHEDMVLSSFYSVVHEGGHALYELNTSDEMYAVKSMLAAGTSSGIHESQSRFWENIIGRSEEFIGFMYPKFVELFPEQMKGVDANKLYLAANKSVPSLIRTEADELTYSLHIMVRYELEKQLMDGTLSTKELPKAWKAMYKEYLGIDVPNDTLGVLQDVHWSEGLMGYFPTYSLGSAYSAQILASLEKDVDVWKNVGAGNLKPLVDWLTARIYSYGSLLDPNEVILSACGAPFESKYYTDYLKKKFTGIYEL